LHTCDYHTFKMTAMTSTHHAPAVASLPSAWRH